MPKKDEDTGEFVISETGNWNTAADFSREKIAKPLIKCDYYEDIAKFGYAYLIDELMGYGIPDDLVRYTGLKRLVEELLKLCNNVEFAMRKLNSKDLLKKQKDRLLEVRKVLPLLAFIKRNASSKSQQLTLDKRFLEVLDVVIEIKSKVNVPLNMNDLIFTHRDEFDPVAFKKKLKDRMINRG